MVDHSDPMPTPESRQVSMSESLLQLALFGPDTSTRQIPISDSMVRQALFGPSALLREIESAVRPFQLSVAQSADGVELKGNSLAVSLAARVIERIVTAFHAERAGKPNVQGLVHTTIEHALKHDLPYRIVGLPKALQPMSLSQVAFMNTLLKAPRALTIGIGPTGSGKTHLAMAAGLNALARGRVKRIVATRPHLFVEGDVVTPPMRAEMTDDDQLVPIEDVLNDLLGHVEVQQLKEREALLMLPLGRLRGRTFNNAFIVVDEAHNLTVSKMRMVVTRLGNQSQMVVTGDPSQSELPGEEPSGLTHLLKLVEGTDVAAVEELAPDHIVRNDVVARLEALYRGGGQMRSVA